VGPGPPSRMTKAELQILEHIFTAEIEGRLPFQFGRRGDPKLALKLESEGYIQRMERTLGGRFPMQVKGWALTLCGNLAYCTWCKDVEE
jgi:hypothetical protein